MHEVVVVLAPTDGKLLPYDEQQGVVIEKQIIIQFSSRTDINWVLEEYVTKLHYAEVKYL